MKITIRHLTPGDMPFLWVALYHAIHTPPIHTARRLYEREGFIADGTPENGSVTMIKRLHSTM